MSNLAADLAQALDLLDPVDLFRRAIGEPDAWQERVLHSTARKLVMVTGRQCGKSTVVAVLAIHLALTVNGSTVLLVAPSLRQSSLLFSTVMGVYNKLTGMDDPEAESKLSVLFSNQSRIVALPGNGGDTIRGFSADAVFCDEAARVPIETLEACRPMMAVRKKSRLVLLTSASWAQGWLWDIWNNAGDKTWQREKVTALECARIDPVWLEGERREMGERAYQQEYLCEFLDPAEALFGAAVLENALSDDISIVRW